MNFNEKVWKKIKKIPRGKVSTYKEIAKALGKKGASRAVGNACNKNPFAPKVPCHRVVCSNAFLGGFARELRAKKRLLEKEGVRVKNNKIVNFKEILMKAGKLK